MTNAVKKTDVRVRQFKKTPKDIKGLRALLDVVSRGKSMWESTFDAIRDPVLIINRDYQIERANLGAAERVKVPIRDLIGKTCYEVFAKRKSVCPKCPLKTTIKNKAPRSVEIDALMPDGDFQVSSYPLEQSRDGAQVVHHYRDVTEEKLLQRKLIQSEKMAAIGMLAGGVAHEINNPLAGILAFTQLLKKEMPTDSQAEGDLKEIEEAARRCKKIVEDLLTFARPHGGGVQKISLAETLEKILPLARLNLKHREITLKIECESGLPLISGSLPRLQQVFLNLIHNAGQSMLRGGVVTIRLFSDPKKSQVIAEVRDQGCGIDSESLGRIFDPFFSTKEGREGTGLGLSICYSIVTEHHGKIEVESQPGKGSCFRVLFPAEVSS